MCRVTFIFPRRHPGTGIRNAAWWSPVLCCAGTSSCSIRQQHYTRMWRIPCERIPPVSVRQYTADMFCELKDLITESDVEQKLVLPLLTTRSPLGLGYNIHEVRTKLSIRRFQIDKGKSQKLYYPD